MSDIRASIRIIVIDPNKQTVEERQIEQSADSCAQQIHDIIGGYFQIACMIRGRDGDDVCMVDDEGLYKNLNYFVLRGWGHEAYAGIGVIVGSGASGETVSAQMPLDEVRRRLVWMVPQPKNEGT